ncbi:hypothetical protein [Tabrizicola thermarum]|uniref:hypothetical protein n=1 Tax=Tabrizicola thermarum TaxID=2670345 RepID=UPI000FFC00C0|nr:hypothetical protein [Tabrizicola thermarum]
MTTSAEREYAHRRVYGRSWGFNVHKGAKALRAVEWRRYLHPYGYWFVPGVGDDPGTEYLFNREYRPIHRRPFKTRVDKTAMFPTDRFPDGGSANHFLAGVPAPLVGPHPAHRKELRARLGKEGAERIHGIAFEGWFYFDGNPPYRDEDWEVHTWATLDAFIGGEDIRHRFFSTHEPFTFPDGYHVPKLRGFDPWVTEELPRLRRWSAVYTDSPPYPDRPERWFTKDGPAPITRPQPTASRARARRHDALADRA